MSVNFNPYENYRIRVFENSGELRNYKKDVVVDNRRERVVLLIGQVAPDKFAIGYDIFFADGGEPDGSRRWSSGISSGNERRSSISWGISSKTVRGSCPLLSRRSTI